jgi:hypothetical protein
MAPLFPPTALPELNTRRPLAPAAPALLDRTKHAPLLVAVPSPVAMLTAPPLVTVLLPEVTASAPPDPLVPLPTDIPKAPARPPVAAPDPKLTAPLFPAFAEPELNLRCPLAPDTPPFAEVTMTAPLLVAVPSPE